MPSNADRRQRLIDAGRWLRSQREHRGYRTAKALADALHVDASLVSNYERGVYSVDDQRAEQIAEVLRLPIIEVRRGLGLWVPAEHQEEVAPERPDIAEQLEDLIERLTTLYDQYIEETTDTQADRRRRSG